MEKAELIFVPAPEVGHLVATLEFAKRLINGDDRILITVLVMKVPFLTSFLDGYTKSLKSFTASQSRIQLIDLPELPTRHDQIRTVFEPSNSQVSILGIVNPVPVSVLPLDLFHNSGYSTYIKLAQRFNDANGINVYTFSELESYGVNSFSGSLNPQVYTVGPKIELKAQRKHDLDEDRCQKIFKWLDDQPESSVVFLCFGSGGSFSPAQVREMATGHEKSEYNFLWSLLVNNDVTVIVIA
ncbi:hypothetical protein QYF36_022431 [Acer negundo]|nr:hypothetical protein QYF36_022431 [Acer negundo]